MTMDNSLLRFYLGRPRAKRYLFRDRWVTIAEAAKLLGLSYYATRDRIRGDTIEDTPRRRGGTVPKRYLFRGQRLTVPEIATLLGCPKQYLYGRIMGDRVLEADEAKAIPRERRDDERLLFFEGITRNVAEWARAQGMPKGALYSHLRMGWSIERALTTSVAHPRRLVLVRMVTAFRRARNAHAIARMAAAFAAAHASTPTRGVSETFPNASGTGGRSRVNDLH